MLIINLCLLLIYSIIYGLKNCNTIISFICTISIILFIVGNIFYRYKPRYTKRNIIISFGISILIVLFTINTFNFKYNTDKIKIENIGKTPITVEAIYKDEKINKTNNKYYKKYDKINNASLKTEYQLYNKTDESYKMTLLPKKVYYIPIRKCKHIEIDFQRIMDQLPVKINNKKYNIESYSALTPKAWMVYDSSFKYNYNNTSINYDVVTVLMIILTFILSFNLSIRVIDNKREIMQCLLLLIIELNQIIKISSLSKITILVLFLIITRNGEQRVDKKYNLIRLISSLMIGFSFVGDRILNQKIDFTLLMICTLLVILIYLIIPFIFNYINYIINKDSNNNETDHNTRFHRIILFLLVLFICFIYGYIFYPYISHVDFEMEYADILGGTYSNWHPYFHILVLKLFYSIFKNFNIFIYFRYIIYSLLLNSILFYFRKNGLSIKRIYVYSILITIFPVTGIMLATPIKDVDFTLAIIALTFYFFLIINNFDYFKKYKHNYICLFVSLICTCLFRHNGLYIFVVMSLILFIISFKYKRKLLIIPVLLSIFVVFMIEKPLYNYLKVEDKPRNFDIIPVIHGFSALIVENKKIDKLTYEYLTKEVLTEEQFINGYDKYNSDLLLYYTDESFRDKKIDKNFIILMYGKQMLITPITLIKDRLYATDMLWNVSGKDGRKVSKYQILYDEYESKYIPHPGIYRYNDFFVNIINKFLVFISNSELFDSIVFRTGIYLDILLILINYCIQKKKKQILAIVPVVVNVLTLFLAMPNQVYRYIWFLQLGVMFVWLAVKYYKTES